MLNAPVILVLVVLVFFAILMARGQPPWRHMFVLVSLIVVGVGWALLQSLSSLGWTRPGFVMEPTLLGVVEDSLPNPEPGYNTHLVDGKEVPINVWDGFGLSGRLDTGDLLLIADSGAEFYYMALAPADDHPAGECYVIEGPAWLDGGGIVFGRIVPQNGNLRWPWAPDTIGIRLQRAPGYSPSELQWQDEGRVRGHGFDLALTACVSPEGVVSDRSIPTSHGVGAVQPLG